MKKIKYVVIKGNFGTETIIIFPEHLSHKDAKGEFEAISAGFVGFTYEEDKYGETCALPYCYGRSITLSLESRPDEDSFLARMMFN